MFSVFFLCFFKVLISLRSCTEKGLGTMGEAKGLLRAVGRLRGFTLPRRTHSSPHHPEASAFTKCGREYLSTIAINTPSKKKKYSSNLK